MSSAQFGKQVLFIRHLYPCTETIPKTWVTAGLWELQGGSVRAEPCARAAGAISLPRALLTASTLAAGGSGGAEAITCRRPRVRAASPAPPAPRSFPAAFEVQPPPEGPLGERGDRGARGEGGRGVARSRVSLFPRK